MLKVLGTLVVKGLLKVATYFIPTPSGENRLYLWGYNISGQLGDNTLINRSSPVQTISDGINWYKLGQGQANSAGIKTDGTLWIWGGGSSGELGDNTNIAKSSPVQTVAGGTNWADYSLGSNHRLGLKINGELWTWGFNSYGQLGDNTTSSKSSPVQTIGNANTWKQVSAGNFHSAAIKNDGTLWIWGANTFGQLGDNTILSKSSPIQTITFGTSWKQVACGANHTAAIKTDGTLWLWGLNTNAVLGDNSTTSKSSPVQTIAGGTNWNQVSAGNSVTAAIKTDGTLWVWGDNYYGTVGDNTTVSKSSPVQTITFGTNWIKVSTANAVAGALKADGTLWIWGRNYFGEVGDNTSIMRSSPVQTVNSGNGWKDIAAGSGYTFAGIYQSTVTTTTTTTPAPAGRLWNWGNNYFGRLGDNTQISKSSPVQTIANGTNWTKISQGYNTCGGIKTDGTLWLWGKNAYGQIGNDTTSTSQLSPVQTISGGTDWMDLSLGEAHAAGIKNDGRLWIWGGNFEGELGTDDTNNYSSPVQTIALGNNWKQVSCGNFATAAIKTDGTLWLWGYNSNGQLGDGTVDNKSSPVQTVAGGNNWKQVKLGSLHTIATKTDGTLWCWGRNYFGQLGNDDTIDVSSPIQTITYGTNWKQVSAGQHHSAAVKNDGTIWVWGINGYGQLGDNSISYKSSPVQTIAYGTNWSKVSCGDLHTGGLKTDGTFWVWGYNGYGQIGDDTVIDKSSPVQTITYGIDWLEISCGFRGCAAIKSS